MSREARLGLVGSSAKPAPALSIARLVLPCGWLIGAVGYYGPWIAHSTAALALTGVDMGEFVKFLPAAQSGALPVIRQLFYLPPLAIVLGVALLMSTPGLRYHPVVRMAAVVLAVPVSLQLLPPAWSPASLLSDEFRLQLIALVLCWLALATSWLLGRLPTWLIGGLAAGLAAGALAGSVWQMNLVKPEIDTLYGRPPAIGWGFQACLVGLAATLLGSLLAVVRGKRRRERRGSRDW